MIYKHWLFKKVGFTSGVVLLLNIGANGGGAGEEKGLGRAHADLKPETNVKSFEILVEIPWRVRNRHGLLLGIFRQASLSEEPQHL